MAENKTKPTRVRPTTFLRSVENERRRRDGQELLELMADVTGEPPVMWGPSIIGFGQYHYKYESGHEGDIMVVGFSPRKQHLVLYIGPSLNDAKLMAGLGKHKRGKGCLYINKLDDVDRKVLRRLIEKGVSETRRRISGS